MISKLRFREKKTLPIIMQSQMAECAHACIAMISSFFGKENSLSSIRRIHPPSTNGSNLRHIVRILEEIGFGARVLRVSPKEIHKIRTPAILHWNENHFVVLKSVHTRKIIVHDPAVGVCRFTRAEFLENFSGIALEIEITRYINQLSAPLTPFTIRTLFKLISGKRRLFGLLFFLSIIIECMQLMNPMLMQYVLDYVVGSNILRQLYTLSIGCLWFLLMHGMAEYLRSHLVLYITMEMTETLASNLFKHILSLPLRFFTHRHLSDIQSKFQSIEQIKSKLSSDIVYTFIDAVMVIFTLTLMFFYNVILASIITCMLLMYMGSLYGSFQGYKTHLSKAIILHARSNLVFHEILHTIASLKIFGKESLKHQLWRNTYIEALNHDISISKLQIVYRVLNQMLFHAEYVVVICVGANLVLSQQLTIGMLLAFLTYRLMLVNKAYAFVQYIFSYQLLSIQISRLNDFIEENSEIEPPNGLYASLDVRQLHLKNISFQYHSCEKKILNNINFSVSLGEKIAIIGPSGCGKTTLIKIIMGLEKPTEGVLFVEDLPMQIFGIQNFRKLCASVFQDDSLFTGSILENIVFFDEEVDLTKIYEVARIACIHETILKLPMGYETLIGQSSATISGGQKQRLLLARALYKNPKFLFLDEATSHLDLETERVLNHALKQLDITQIIVAHRPETIAMADRVYDLSEMSKRST